MLKKLYVAITMDCERIDSESPSGGPDTWLASEKAIRGFGELLITEKFPPTFFMMPECGENHPLLFRELSDKGAELGMHMHPQAFLDHRYHLYLGQYGKDIQTEILSKGKRILEDSLGINPVSFRPGNFSANKDTFEALISLGFRQGSISDPGRSCPGYAAVWDSTDIFPHWIYSGCKNEMKFLDIPINTDGEKRHENGFPYELRIESGGFTDWHMPIINRYLEKLEHEDMPYGCLCVFTHNVFSYDNQNNEHSITLKKMIEFIKTIDTYEVIPSTCYMIRKDIEKTKNL